MGQVEAEEERDKGRGVKRETFSRHSHENTLVTQSWAKEVQRLVAGVGRWEGERVLPSSKNFNNHFYFYYLKFLVTRGGKRRRIEEGKPSSNFMRSGRMVSKRFPL